MAAIQVSSFKTIFVNTLTVINVSLGSSILFQIKVSFQKGAAIYLGAFWASLIKFLIQIEPATLPPLKVANDWCSNKNHGAGGQQPWRSAPCICFFTAEPGCSASVSRLPVKASRHPMTWRNSTASRTKTGHWRTQAGNKWHSKIWRSIKVRSA